MRSGAQCEGVRNRVPSPGPGIPPPAREALFGSYNNGHPQESTLPCLNHMANMGEAGPGPLSPNIQ